MERILPRLKKGKYSNSVITKDLYKRFKTEFPEYSHFSWEDFYIRWMEIAETIREEAIFNPLGVKLGSYMGELKLQYIPYKFMATDPKTSKEEGKRVNFLNITSRGKVAKVRWERRQAGRFNKMLQLFGFEPIRQLSRMAKSRIKANPLELKIARNNPINDNLWTKVKKDVNKKNRNKSA